ncbi:MAG: DUF2382 domain-containing protein [Actinomycetes bacterium]
MEVTAQQLEGWIGRNLIDISGETIGEITDIYVDDEHGQPEWLAVHTGMFGSNVSFVPLRGATAAGGDLQVPYPTAQVKDAPNAGSDGHLSKYEEARLYAHYGYDYGEDYAEPQAEMATGTATAPATQAPTDDAMTRSEEELEVGTRTREAGRVRLRKWVDVERVETTVPVTREEVRIEREPITDDNIDRAMSGAEISESEHEVVLHEEEAVVNTRVQPKERIRLAKGAVEDEEVVEADLRKERIEIEDDTTRR